MAEFIKKMLMIGFFPFETYAADPDPDSAENLNVDPGPCLYFQSRSSFRILELKSNTNN